MTTPIDGRPTHFRVLTAKAACTLEWKPRLTNIANNVTCPACIIECGIRPPRRVALARDASDSCEAGTVGCCIDHKLDKGSCETW